MKLLGLPVLPVGLLYLQDFGDVLWCLMETDLDVTLS